MANNEDWWDKVEGAAPAQGPKEPAEPRLYAVSIEDLVEVQRLAIQPFLGSLLILCHAAAESGLIDRDAQVAAVKGLSSDPDDVLEAYLREAQKRRIRRDAAAGRPDWLVEVIDCGMPENDDEDDATTPANEPHAKLH